MKILYNMIILHLLCLSICGCHDTSSDEISNTYFESPSNVVQVRAHDLKSINQEVLDNPQIDLCVSFEPKASSRTIYSALHELARYRVRVYLNLGAKNIYYGFPVHDGYATHPWYKYWSEHFTDSDSLSHARIHELQVFPQGYVMSDKKRSIVEIEKLLKTCDTNDVFNVRLSDNSTFSGLLPLLKKFHEYKIYQYILSIEPER